MSRPLSQRCPSTSGVHLRHGTEETARNTSGPPKTVCGQGVNNVALSLGWGLGVPTAE